MVLYCLLSIQVWYHLVYVFRYFILSHNTRRLWMVCIIFFVFEDFFLDLFHSFISYKQNQQNCLANISVSQASYCCIFVGFCLKCCKIWITPSQSFGQKFVGHKYLLAKIYELLILWQKFIYFLIKKVLCNIKLHEDDLNLRDPGMVWIN